MHGRRTPPISRFSSTLRLGNSRRPSGTIARPRAHDLAGRHAADGLPSKRTPEPRTFTHQAGERLQERALAGAVGADDRHHLAGVESEVDAEQRLRIAVEAAFSPGSEAAAGSLSACNCRLGCLHPHVDPAHLLVVHHRLRFALGQAGWPKLMTSERSATASSACTTCSIQIIVTPRSLDARSSATSSRASGSVRPPAISSSSSSLGALSPAHAPARAACGSSSVRLPAGWLALAAFQAGLLQHLDAPWWPRPRALVWPPPKQAAVTRFSNTVMPEGLRHLVAAADAGATALVRRQRW